MGEEPTSYGALVRRFREARGLLQRDLAYAVAKDASFINKIENEKTIPNAEFLLRLATALNLTEEENHQLVDAVNLARRATLENKLERHAEQTRTLVTGGTAPTVAPSIQIDPVGSITELATELARNEELRDLVQQLSRVYQDERKRKALQSMLDMMENT